MLTKKELKIFIAGCSNYQNFIYRQLLHELGFRHIYTMPDAASCLNNIVLKPDVILLDYSIENSTGVEVLKKIKNNSPAVYVVILSEISEVKAAEDALNYGAYQLIVKNGKEVEQINSILEKISSMKITKTQKSTNMLKRVMGLFS